LRANEADRAGTKRVHGCRDWRLKRARTVPDRGSKTPDRWFEARPRAGAR
jgi:hypothetical protein